MSNCIVMPGAASSLQVLRGEDLVLRELLGQVRRDQDPEEVVDRQSRAASVEQRYRYGKAVKEVLRHLAIRQSAAIDVATAIVASPDLQATSATIIDRATRCRALIGELRGVVRSHPLMSLNAEGAFVPRFAQLMELADATISWELDEGIPLIEQSIDANLWTAEFHNARYVVRHARTKLHPGGPQWYERAPLVSRFLTVWDHFMDAGFFRHGCGPE